MLKIKTFQGLLLQPSTAFNQSVAAELLSVFLNPIRNSLGWNGTKSKLYQEVQITCNTTAFTKRPWKGLGKSDHVEMSILMALLWEKKFQPSWFDLMYLSNALKPTKANQKIHECLQNMRNTSMTPHLRLLQSAMAHFAFQTKLAFIKSLKQNNWLWSLRPLLLLLLPLEHDL